MSDGKRDNIDDRSMVCVPIAALVGVEWHMLFCVSLFMVYQVVYMLFRRSVYGLSGCLCLCSTRTPRVTFLPFLVLSTPSLGAAGIKLSSISTYLVHIFQRAQGTRDATRPFPQAARRRETVTPPQERVELTL